MSPCQACGACCAAYRVTLHNDELDDLPGGRVPAGLAEPVGSQLSCMRGTAESPRRCVALRGVIGTAVACAIYEFRPAACSEFAPLAAVGLGDEACNQARRLHRLPALGVVATGAANREVSVVESCSSRRLAAAGGLK